MATEVTLPALGESVTEGTVTRWLKQVGDTVSVDEALLEVSTDKVDTEIPSPVAGTLLEIKAAEDETVEVGAVLAVIGDEGESAGGDRLASEPPGSRPTRPTPRPRPRTTPRPRPRPRSGARAAERARRPSSEPEQEQPAAQEQRPAAASSAARPPR